MVDVAQKYAGRRTSFCDSSSCGEYDMPVGRDIKGVVGMDTIAAVKNRILQLCGQRGISINRLATLCGLPPSSIKNILYGKSQNPKVLTIKMICDGLDMTLGEFFSTAEFDALEQELR